MLHVSLTLTLTPLLLAQGGTNPPAGATNTLVIWGVVLIGVALALFVVELFIPSGGLIGFLSAASLIAGIVLFAQVNTTLGLVTAVVAMAAMPLLIGFAIRIWPDTWIAQLLTLKTDDAQAARAPDPTDQSRRALLGRRGEALTDLRPVGTCLIDGRREECLANRGVIQAGTPVEVVAVDGMQMKVKPVE